MPIDLLAQSAALFCSYGFRGFGGHAEHHPVKLRHQVRTQDNRPSVFVLGISPPQEGNCRVQTQCDCPSVFVLGISPP